jgi:hypothetical protein
LSELFSTDPSSIQTASSAGLSLDDALLLEAVRCVEEEGPLDDTEALHAALAASDDVSKTLVLRARTLGTRIGLQPTMARARAVLPWVMIGLAVLVVLAGAGLAGKVVGTGDGSHRINVIAALGSLLGLHVFTLLIWLAGLFWSPNAWRHSLVGIWLLLSARVAGGRHGQGRLLLQAATRLLSRSRMLPWVLGLASHTIWTLSFAVALGALLFALAFRRYTLGWETTILEPGFFVRLVHGLGYLPAQLGFPIPTAATILAATGGSAPADPAGQRDWALWMTGCITLYGLLPRMLLALLCVAMLRARRMALLTPDLQAPYYRQLLARLAALVPATRIVDADPGRAAAIPPLPGLRPQDASNAQVAIGFELAQEASWPPDSWPSEVAAWHCNGSAASRKEVLGRLAQLRPNRVLLVCDEDASPDRGTERFVREVLARSGRVDLCLLQECAASVASPEPLKQRWQNWLADGGLPSVHLVSDWPTWLAAAPEGTV